MAFPLKKISLFGSTSACEQFFSQMKYIQFNQRFRLPLHRPYGEFPGAESHDFRHLCKSWTSRERHPSSGIPPNSIRDGLMSLEVYTWTHIFCRIQVTIPDNGVVSMFHPLSEALSSGLHFWLQLIEIFHVFLHKLFAGMLNFRKISLVPFELQGVVHCTKHTCSRTKKTLF